MMNADYYRDHAARARRLATRISNRKDIAQQLHHMAQDYDEIAIDLEEGAIDIRHPELMPQQQRERSKI